MADYQSVKDRLLIFVNYTSLSVSAFEKKCNLSNAYIRNFKGNMSADKLEGILKAFPELSKEWLLTGRGEMLAAPDNSRTIVNNTGIANNGDNAILNPPAPSKELDTMLEMLKMKDEQIGELISQNGKLMNIIDRLTQNK